MEQKRLKLTFGCDTEKIYVHSDDSFFTEVEKKYLEDALTELKTATKFYFFWARNDATGETIPAGIGGDNVIVVEEELKILKAKVEEKLKNGENWRTNCGLSHIEVERDELEKWEKGLKLELEKEAKEREIKKDMELKRALEQAKKTGKNVIVSISSHDGDSDTEARKKFGDDCGIIHSYYEVTPGGEINKKMCASY